MQSTMERPEWVSSSLQNRTLRQVALDRFTDKMKNGAFDFPAYDYLHILSLTKYENQLNELEISIRDGLGNAVEDERFDGLLQQIRAVMKEYCEYLPHPPPDLVLTIIIV